MTKKIFNKGIALLTACFPNRDFNINSCWLLLQDVKDIQFMVAVKEVCYSVKELYPDSNLVAIIKEKIKSANNITAEEEWENVDDQIRRGEFRPEFENEITKNTVNTIGWQSFRDVTTKNIIFLRRDFIKTYNILIDRKNRNDLYLIEEKQIKLLTDEQVKENKDKVHQMTKQIAKKRRVL